ncbi:MAG: hypothetical protein M1587_09195 [Thaumarchaeota archaeon]|nr:hypothetical protein [Nitrososphaerota archaeon]
MNTRRLVLLSFIVLIGISLVGVVLLVEQSQSAIDTHSVSLQKPIVHTPTFLGNHRFILGSGNVIQNGSAYSYVWINASALQPGESFVAYPALNVGLVGKAIDESNFSVAITYEGSTFGSDPYWLNFSVSIPSLTTRINSSQIGIEGTFARTSYPIQGFKGALFYTQISNVVGESNEFEYFFYVGNSSTPIPQLAHGPVH